MPWRFLPHLTFVHRSTGALSLYARAHVPMEHLAVRSHSNNVCIEGTPPVATPSLRMILQPCNVELTKIHYYDHTKRENNLAISTISREVCQNNFNRNVIIKRNVFGHRWVLRINDGERGGKKKKRLRVVVYILVFCSIIVAVCFGIFFSVCKLM